MLTELPKKVPEFDTLTHDGLMMVADLAGGLTKEEILEGMMIDYDDLTEKEQLYLDQFYKVGRLLTMQKVFNNFIESTKGRQGSHAAMQYMRRFMKNFEGEIEGGDGHFSFQANF